MKIKHLIFAILFFLSNIVQSQNLFQYQYFEPIDTNVVLDTIIYNMDSLSKKTWHVGIPKKKMFNAALSNPNVLITDTVNAYDTSVTASVIFDFTKYSNGTNWGNILAIQWSQKLDLEDSADFGIVEYSIDSGLTWTNYLGNLDFGPRINFYGFNNNNLFQYNLNEMGYFTGTDSIWRDIWLCFYSRDGLNPWADEFMLRFTLKSDKNQANNEGWQIDNMMVHESFVHTVKNKLKEKNKLVVFPNIADRIINIESTYKEEESFIQELIITNSQGELIKKYKSNKRRVSIDISDLPNGYYYVKAFTANKTSPLPFLVQH